MAQRKRHTPEFKAKVALEAIREQKTAGQIASEYEVHPTQVSQWKKDAIQHLAAAFQTGSPKGDVKKDEILQDRLYSQIGQLKVELDWLKKKSAEFS
jgi:transposase-like protein